MRSYTTILANEKAYRESITGLHLFPGVDISRMAMGEISVYLYGRGTTNHSFFKCLNPDYMGINIDVKEFHSIHVQANIFSKSSQRHVEYRMRIDELLLLNLASKLLKKPGRP